MWLWCYALGDVLCPDQPTRNRSYLRPARKLCNRTGQGKALKALQCLPVSLHVETSGLKLALAIPTVKA